MESKKGALILHIMRPLERTETYEKLYKYCKKCLNDGLLIIPNWIYPIYIPEGIEVKLEENANEDI